MGIGFHIPPEDVATPSRAPEDSGPLRTGNAEDRRIAPWVAGLAILAFFAAFFPAQKALLWDEAVYLSTAENLGKTNPYYSEIASRPPLLPVLLRLGGSVMRLETFARLLGAGFFAAGVVVLYLLGRKLFGRAAGVISAGLMALCPFFLHFAHKVMPEVPAAVLGAAAMLCFFELAREEEDEAHRNVAIAAGVLLAAAVMMRFEVGVLAIVPVYLWLANRVGFRPIAIALGSAVAGLAPYLVWAQIRLGGFWKPFVAGDAGGGGEAIYYIRAVWMIAGPLVLAGMVLYLAPLGRRRGDTAGRDIPLLAWFVLLFVCLAASQPKEPRFLLPAFPVLFLYAGAGYARCNRKQLAGFAAAVAIIGGGYEIGHRAFFSGSLDMGEAQLMSYAERTREAADYLRPQLHPPDVVYTSSLFPLVAWYSKAHTVALWPWSDEFYAEYPKNMKRDGYLMFFRGFAKEPNEVWLDHRLEFRKVKEFPDVIIYAYSIPVPLPSPPTQ